MKKAGIIAVVAGTVIAFWSAMVSRREAASIGIIGGADGPTAIFVAGEVFSPLAIAGGALGILAAVLGAFMIWKKRK